MQTVLYSKFTYRYIRRQAILIIGISLCFSLDTCAQSAKQYIAYGDEAMKKGDYYNAAEYYKQGLDKYEFNLEMEYKYAEALRGFNDYKNAADVYKKVTDEDVTHEYPLSAFWYGMMLHSLGKYEQAITQFKKFRNRYNEKGYYRDKAQQEIESCTWANVNIKDTASLKIIHLPEGVNTAFTETNPFEARGHKFLFTSMRNQSTKKGKEKFLTRIYEADSTYTITKLFPVEGDQQKHIANGAFSPDWSHFYFTICEPDEENRSVLKCEIYVSEVSHDSLMAPERLSDNINAPGTTSTQPNVGVSENGEHILYFVSNRPGGAGKTDIWMSKIINDTTYNDPVNLGAVINSLDEEFSPYYDNQEHKLYFASNWYYGFGGLDIFETRNINGQWSAPRNIGHAINSPQNDFYFYKSTDRSKNYFASNRKGSLYLKSETCCNDIWMYETGKKMTEPPVSDTVETKITATVVTDTPTIKNESVPVTSVTTAHDTSTRVWIDRSVTKIKQLLPVTLYFHNDEPECCNLRDTTALNYVATYQDYWRLLDKYKSEFDKGLKGDRKNEADREVFDLFTGKVEKGYHDLIQFSAQLLDILHSGQKMEITIQGYCSPLNYSEYNIQLGYRRIASLRNYFYHYRDGALMPYITDGRLILKNESLGKERAAKDVSGNREDVRNSVYNPAAAVERKVEIISVESK